MANKRINPRHIVVDKRNVNLDAIVDEAMKDDIHDNKYSARKA